MGPSKSPNKAEREWMAAVREFGCVACYLDGKRRECVVHHIVSGNRRMGHMFTIGLCEPGHHQHGDSVGMVSRHPYKARFEAQYGTEMELLAILKREIDGFTEWRVA